MRGAAVLRAGALLVGALVAGCGVPMLVKPAAESRIVLRVAVKPGAQYRGNLETVEVDGERLLVNNVELEEYVRGVLPGEVQPSWPPEALKAMAIVVRTYAFAKWRKGGGSMPPLSADSRDQEYCGFNCEDGRTNSAVEATRGVIIRYGETPLPAFSHSCCAGHTEDAREVWGGDAPSALWGVPCGWCSRSAHFGPWTLIFDKTFLAKRLKGALDGAKEVRTLSAQGQTPSGRVKTVMVTTEAGECRFTAEKFRALVGYNDVRSTRFTLEDMRDTVRIVGNGWGHGVGICQEGARAFAEAGTDHMRILAYYFPGMNLWRLRR